MFDDVAAFERGFKGHQPPVDLGSGGVQSYRRVDGESGVDDAGVLGQLDHVAFGREDEDDIGEEIELQRVEEGVAGLARVAFA